jgi:hypothetical protein
MFEKHEWVLLYIVLYIYPHIRTRLCLYIYDITCI